LFAPNRKRQPRIHVRFERSEQLRHEHFGDLRRTRQIADEHGGFLLDLVLRERHTEHEQVVRAQRPVTAAPICQPLSELSALTARMLSTDRTGRSCTT
jgi:hypothetical protein